MVLIFLNILIHLGNKTKQSVYHIFKFMALNLKTKTNSHFYYNHLKRISQKAPLWGISTLRSIVLIYEN